jgi:hypothetical protein
MKTSFTSLIILVCSLSILSFTKDNCSVLKKNQYTYKRANKEVLVVFKDNSHIEYHNNKEHFIKSEIQWVSDCEYYLTIKETTLPRFPFKIGSKLHIVVTKVKGNKVYYRSTLEGKTWEGKLTKKKKPR